MTWLNDMETDDSTADWNPSLQALLEPSWSMQIYIRKNLFTAVLPVDPGSADGLFTLASLSDNLTADAYPHGLAHSRGSSRHACAMGRLGERTPGKDGYCCRHRDGADNLSPLIARKVTAKKRGNLKALKWATELYEV